MSKKLLPLLVLALSGCSEPSDQQLRTDFQSLHPGCELVSFVAADGDFDHISIEFTYVCRPVRAALRSYALYEHHNSHWRLNRKMSERSPSRPPPGAAPNAAG